jgi:hypothetical protein
MRKQMAIILLLAGTVVPLTGCVVYPDRPYVAAHWVPGHWGPYGVWHPGHWA